MRPRGRVVAVPDPLVGQYGLAAGVKEEELDSSDSSEALWHYCSSCFPAAGQTKMVVGARRGRSSVGTAVMRPRGRVVAVPAPLIG